MKTKLFLLGLIFLGLFTYFSYVVAKERLQQFDFDTTVKLQDKIPRKFDRFFSYFSILGSAEITVGLCLLFAFKALLRFRWKEFIGWLMILPATAGEVFGKLVLFHPSPPQFFHRSLLPTSLPSFYVHTNFSYPSGHMTRTIFLVTVLIILVLFSSRGTTWKFPVLVMLLTFVFLMGLTRVYLGEHWFSDVVGGTILGVASGSMASILILRKDRANITADARGR